jgi:hypothetical protein
MLYSLKDEETMPDGLPYKVLTNMNASNGIEHNNQIA